MTVNPSQGERMDAVDLCRALELAVDAWERVVTIEESHVVYKDPETMRKEVVSKDAKALIDHFEFADVLREKIRESNHAHLGIVSTQPPTLVRIESGEFSALIEPESTSPRVDLYHEGDRIIESQDLYATVKRPAELDAYLDDLGYGEPWIQAQLQSRTSAGDQR